MRIGVIVASSQAEKHDLLCECVRKAAPEHEVIGFGCFDGDTEVYAYPDIAFEAGLLLASGAVDFIVTGCSSGQGMMLACNALPGVLCGYLPTPQDAFLFGRINGGNAASLPLGLNFGWLGEINLQCTLDKLFEGGFGTGYPPESAARKQRDALRVKAMHDECKRSFAEIIPGHPVRDIVREYVIKNGTGISL